MYDKVRAAGGTALFFCVAGQNRSATLAVAVQMLRGVSLDGILAQCSTTRPFIVENKGFQRQLVELEGKLVPPAPRGAQAHRFGSELMPKRPRLDESPVDDDGEEKEGHVLCELFVPGVGPINLWLPSQCSIDTARWYLITAVDHELEKEGKRSGMAWLIFSTFGANLPEGFNLVLEDAAVERHVQLARLRDAFGLELVGDDPLAADCEVRWTGACRFEVILFTFFWRPPPADDARLRRRRVVGPPRRARAAVHLPPRRARDGARHAARARRRRPVRPRVGLLLRRAVPVDRVDRLLLLSRRRQVEARLYGDLGRRARAPAV